MRDRATKRVLVDWETLLMDIRRHGISSHDLAALLGVPRSTLIDYRDRGMEPKHAVGEKIIAQWCQFLGKARDEVPLARS